MLCIENKAGVWRKSPRQPESNRGSGAEPPTLRRFYSFFPETIRIFKLLWSKFRAFKWLNKVLMCPQDLRPGARVSALLLLRYWGQKQKQYICYHYSIRAL